MHFHEKLWQRSPQHTNTLDPDHIARQAQPHCNGSSAVVQVTDGKNGSKSTSEGFIWIKRYPLEVFGDGDKNSTKIPVVRLDCDKKTREDVNSMEDKWQSRCSPLSNSPSPPDSLFPQTPPLFSPSHPPSLRIFD